MARRQAIIWTDADLVSIGHRERNFSENLIEIQKFSLKKIRFHMPSANWWPFCSGHNVFVSWMVVCRNEHLKKSRHSAAGVRISSLRTWYSLWWRHQMETFSALLTICAGNSPVPGEFQHKGQWRGALMFSLICVWINGLVNFGVAGDLRRYRVHYDVIVMSRKRVKSLMLLYISFQAADGLVYLGAEYFGVTHTYVLGEGDHGKRYRGPVLKLQVYDLKQRLKRYCFIT